MSDASKTKVWSDPVVIGDVVLLAPRVDGEPYEEIEVKSAALAAYCEQERRRMLGRGREL